jgi:hypothetical protein
MKNKILIFAIAAIFLSSGVVAVAQYQAGYNNNNNQQPLPGSNGLMQRFMNKIRDILGICQSGCNLSTLSGVLTYDGTKFFIGTVELHFGPNWYIKSAMSAVDYDQDGQYELIIDELRGLVNTEVTVEGYYQSDGWMCVFTINGENYREPGQPIWHGHGNGPNKP